MRFFRRAQSDFENEVQAHLRLEADQLIAEGLSPKDAELEARRRFGNVSIAQERYYESNPLSWWEDARSDVRYALRLARRHPGFSLNVIVTSALGIAACVATFSLVSGILLKPLNFPQQDRVYSLELQSAEGQWAGIPVSSYRAIDTAAVFDGVAASEPAGAIAEINGERLPLRSGVVSPSYFHVYRVKPELGRFFDQSDSRASSPVVVLSHEIWETRFGSDSTIIGRSILLDDAPKTVIGIAPAGFLGNFEGFQSRPQLWMPTPPPTSDVNLTMRLADGVSKAQAESFLARVARTRVPSSQRRDSIAAMPVLVPVSEMIYGDMRAPLLILLGAVALVLLLVMANIATMFLARSVTRQGELGLRGALGATSGRQLRQLLAESLTLSVIGGVAGVAAAGAIVQVVRALGSNVLSRMDQVSLDWRVMLFAVVAICLTGLAGGVAHHLVSRKPATTEPGTRVAGGKTSSVLVVAQVALALMLLVGAGLLVKGFNRIAPKAPGFITRNRAVLELSLVDDKTLAGNAVATREAITRILDRASTVPGAKAATMVSYVPLRGMVSIADVDLPDAPPSAAGRRGYSNIVSPNYFDVMGIPLKMGRRFDASDVDGANPVVIVSDSAAAKWWPGANPIGREIIAGRGKNRATLTVVGVVAGSRISGRNLRHPPELFKPLAQSAPGWATIVVATDRDPSQLIPELRRVVHAVAPRVPITYASDFASIADDAVRIPRFYSTAMSVFAGASVLLSALGVYGLLAFGVAQRRREIGIRLALGATTTQIGRSVVGRAMLIGAAGVAVGLVAAFGLSRYMASLLVEVTPTDRGVFLICGVAGVVIAALAAAAPAYRATHIDPMRSLRG